MRFLSTFVSVVCLVGLCALSFVLYQKNEEIESLRMKQFGVNEINTHIIDQQDLHIKQFEQRLEKMNGSIAALAEAVNKDMDALREAQKNTQSIITDTVMIHENAYHGDSPTVQRRLQEFRSGTR